MFGWLKKKTPPQLSPELKKFAEKTFGPQAMAIAIAESVGEYVNSVKSGKTEYPAHRRKSPNVEMIWNDVRIEAMHKFFNFGKSDLMLLADFRRQNDLFTSFINDKPHLEFPQPKGQEVEDTLQGIWQVYIYLDAVGSEVMDSTTDRHSLQKQGLDILSYFNSQAKELCELWAFYEQCIRDKNASLPEIPITMLDLLWADITTKTKSIALSTVFGPTPENGMKHMLRHVAENGTPQDVKMVMESFERVRKAREPEDIRKN